MNFVVKFSVVGLGLFATTGAQAANAIVTTSLNLRTGPSARYSAITSIPALARVDVRGCTQGYGWCQVGYRGIYGWASSRYLAMQVGSSNGGSGNFGSSAAAIGIPLIAGVLIGSALNNNNYNRDRYDHYDNWGRRHRPYYRPDYRPDYRPGWNRGGVDIGNGVRPTFPNNNGGISIGNGVYPTQRYYNPYDN